MANQTVTLPVRGMTCANCARSVERKLRSIPGVTQAAVDLEHASTAVTFDADRTRPEALADAVRELGFEVPA